MPPITRGDKNQGCPHESKGNTKNYPRGCQLLALDAVRGAVIGMLIGTGGSKVLLAAALPERKLNLLYRPFAKVGKAALMLYSVPFVLAWILMLFGLTPSSLAQFPGGDVVVILITLAAGWTGYLIRPI